MNNTKLERDARNSCNNVEGYIEELISEIESLEKSVDEKDEKIEELREQLSNTEPI